LLPWQRGDISKLPKITILHWFFPSKFMSKCCNFSMDWDRVKCISALVTRYLIVTGSYTYMFICVIDCPKCPIALIFIILFIHPHIDHILTTITGISI
jgi:hypothetical protein